MDHFDLPSLRSLEAPQTRVVTASKTADLLCAAALRGAVNELGWGENALVGAWFRFARSQVNHWGARMQSDTPRGGYNGYVIESARVSGDLCG